MEVRKGRHVVFELHAHIVFVPHYRKHIFDADSLDAATVEQMKELGAGNLSRGIREAARRLAANALAQGEG